MENAGGSDDGGSKGFQIIFMYHAISYGNNVQIMAHVA
jgi:hypothetical protein